MQDKFNWKSVVASAAGAEVGRAAGPVLGEAFGNSTAGKFGARVATGLVAGTTAAVMRGGKIAIQQVAVDATMQTYVFGECPICGQGQLLGVKTTSGDQLFLMCDECESVWRTPHEVNSFKNVLPDIKFTVRSATLEEIWASDWQGLQKGIVDVTR